VETTDIVLLGHIFFPRSRDLPDDVKETFAGRRVALTLCDPQGNTVVLAGNVKITRLGSLAVPVKAKFAVNLDASDAIQSTFSLGDRQISGQEFVEVTCPETITKVAADHDRLPPGLLRKGRLSESFDLEPHKEVPLKKLNTRPAATHCGRCGQSLVTPKGMSNDYKHCPRCE
jgi:hypothetical protein